MVPLLGITRLSPARASLVTPGSVFMGSLSTVPPPPQQIWPCGPIGPHMVFLMVLQVPGIMGLQFAVDPKGISQPSSSAQPGSEQNWACSFRGLGSYIQPQV